MTSKFQFPSTGCILELTMACSWRNGVLYLEMLIDTYRVSVPP